MSNQCCDNTDKPLILCMAHLPPPVNGVTLMGALVVNSKRLREHFNLQVLPLRSAASISDIGKMRPAKLFRILGQAWELCRVCVLKRPALIYFTLTPNGVAFYRDLLFVAIMKLFRIRRIYHLHGKGITNSVNGSLARFLYNWAFNEADVILLSPSLFNDAEKVLGRSKYHFLANGIADPLDGQEHITSRRDTVPRILFFSNLIVNKGLFVLLESLILLKEQGFSFSASFAGAWESSAVEAEFNRKINENGLQEIVEICGPRYGNEKNMTFKNADIMAFPTYNDAYPLVVLEGMSHGLPVVSTYEGAIPDMVLETETGFLVPRQNVELLTERLKQLLGNVELREKLGQAGRERYKAFFTEEVFTGNLLAILKKSLR